jgi:chromate transporter
VTPKLPAAEEPVVPGLLELFLLFARVGTLAIGGGYVMFPLLKREAVDAKGWITAHELVDYYALGQSVPGIIAMNTAALVGYRKRGLAGAAAAAAGMALPSMAVIMLIAAFLTRYFDTPWVQRAFAGVRAAVVAMIGMAVWQVGSKSVNSMLKGALAGAAFLAMAFLHISPVLLILAGGLLGFLLFRREGGA